MSAPRTMTTEDHRRFGLASNIPACCVEEWLAIHEQQEREYGPDAGLRHPWDVAAQRCWAHADCGFRPAGVLMLDRGLPDVACQYIPCRRCHAEIAAGVREPNTIIECSFEETVEPSMMERAK